MTFLQRLQAHKGGLIQLMTELFWYGGRGWDGTPGRICLLLDADAATRTAAAKASDPRSGDGVTALLLIDGSPQWIWITEADVELL